MTARTKVVTCIGIGGLSVAGVALFWMLAGGDGSAAPSRAVLGAEIFRQCAACHSVGQGGADKYGPNLYGVVGSRIGQNRRRFNYTAALRTVGGRWDRERLDAWLTDPHRFAPGTSMQFAGLADPTDRANVIAYLETGGSRLPSTAPPPGADVPDRPASN